ncbi:hypothetical protein [Spirobacillus cienkowskii]|uniref:Uncharacterized protein n=1 Tax=Spirobacillus cienkowskii TaxID=495820 RepID=A0A369KR16_9BACT|nr:MAG: hypothetical protein DCC88_07385 [Spirobacillus cienkowskii]
MFLKLLRITSFLILTSFYSFNSALALKETKVDKNIKQINLLQNSPALVYNIYAGNKLIASNEQSHLLRSNSKNPLTSIYLPGYEMPSFAHIDEYIQSHNNALPLTWGAEEGNKRTWAQAKPYSSLGQDLATELVCTDVTGCKGDIAFSNWAGSIFISNSKSQQSGYFTTSRSSSLFDKVYVTDGKGDFIEISMTGFNWSHYPFDVKFNEPIAYLLLNPENKNAYINDINEPLFDGTETQSAGTFWKLAWQSLMGAGTSIDNTYSIAHGLTKTEIDSLGYQIGAEFTSGIPGIFELNISSSIYQRWDKSTAVNDVKSYSTRISFPADNYDSVVAYYNLMLGFHTYAPLLEKFLDPNNPNGFNAKINESVKSDSFVSLELARSLPIGSTGVETNIDAQTPSGEFIYGTIKKPSI